MNIIKTEVMIDSGDSARCYQLAQCVGVAYGALPVRYLGVPSHQKRCVEPISIRC